MAESQKPSESQGKPAAAAPAGAASKPASGRSASGVDPVMEQLLKNSAQVTQEPCPQCKAFMKPGAEICTSCGFSKKTGKNMNTRVTVEAAPKRSSGPNPVIATITGLSPILLIVILLVVVGGPLFAGLAMGSQILFLIGVLLLIALGLTTFIFTIADGFRMSTGTGLTLLITYFIPLLGLYWVYYIFFKSPSEHLRAFVVASIAINLAFAVAVIAGLGDLDALLQF